MTISPSAADEKLTAVQRVAVALDKAEGYGDSKRLRGFPHAANRFIRQGNGDAAVNIVIPAEGVEALQHAFAEENQLGVSGAGAHGIQH